MHIKKIGHCCLVIEIKGKVIVTDPGSYTPAAGELTGIDGIVITHEHQDHLHVPSVQGLLAKNPSAKIITNSAVGKQLEAAGIPFLAAEGRGRADIGGISLEAFDCKHEEIYQEIGQVQNTGYMIGGKLFYPGDSFFEPGVPVETLALPVAGPWCRIRDAIRYALAVRPKNAFPVHDGGVVKEARGFPARVLTDLLKQNGTAFTGLDEGGEADF